MPEPTVIIAPFVVVAETKKLAEEYAEALDFWLLGKDNFSYYPDFPSVEAARQYPYTEKEKEIVQANRFCMVVGDSESVTEQINEMISQFKADEVMFVPLMPGFEARKKAIKLLAKHLIKRSKKTERGGNINAEKIYPHF